MKLRLSLLLLCLVTFSAEQARADTLVITSGHGIIGGGGFVTFQNADASVVVNLFPNSSTVTPTGVRSPGSPVNVDFSGGGRDVTGTITVNGITYFAVGALHFGTTGTALYPSDSNFSGSVFTTFALTNLNSVLAFTDNPFSNTLAQQVFTFDLVGGGLAEAEVFGTGLGVFNQVRVNYTFTQPVPEPATLLLLSSGLAGVVGVARKRRRASWQDS